MRQNKICETMIYTRLCGDAYILQKKDLDDAADVMAEAFSDDASIRYLLGGTGVGNHDRKYFHCILKALYGKCVILSTDENVNNLLILFSPRLKAVPVLPFLLKGGVGLCRYFGLSLFVRSLNYENNCKKVKSRFMTQKTWYCMCFAVSPKMQRRGVGSQLLRPVLKILTEEGHPLYLETHKKENVRMYEHLGFETVATSMIPGTEIIQYSMIRKRHL